MPGFDQKQVAEFKEVSNQLKENLFYQKKRGFKKIYSIENFEYLNNLLIINLNNLINK